MNKKKKTHTFIDKAKLNIKYYSDTHLPHTSNKLNLSIFISDQLKVCLI